MPARPGSGPSPAGDGRGGHPRRPPWPLPATAAAVADDGPYTARVTRDELILATRNLVAEGDRLAAAPGMAALRVWLQRCDDLLADAWGSMDRYHLVWLTVGKPKDTPRGRAMTPAEESAYIREVAEQKTAALRMSLDAVERQHMPFRGETGGIGAGQGMGQVPGDMGGGGATSGMGGRGAVPGSASTRFDLPPAADDLGERVRAAREEAARHAAADHRPRAPRPERMQR